MSDLGREMSMLKRTASEAFVTNWFGGWSGEERIAAFVIDGGLAFRRAGDLFDRAYFASSSAEALERALAGLTHRRELVLDNVTQRPSQQVDEAIRGAGFRALARYARLTNRRLPKGRRSSPSTEAATRADLDELGSRLRIDFDPRLDHLPEQTELACLLDSKRVLVSRSGDRISGYLVYDVVGSRSTLRYWFSDGREVPLRAFDLLWAYYEAMEYAQVTECRAWVDVAKHRVAGVHRRCGFVPDGLVDDTYSRLP
jgi:hypothetical protein